MKRDDDRPFSLQIESALSLKERIQRLEIELRACVDAKRPADLSTPPHREITEALHTLVYESGPASKLLVVYNDTTRGESFPVRALGLPENSLTWKNENPLNIGTLTFRHVDYDDFVDLYLIRDRETRAITNREIEALAYKRMTEILNDSLLKGEHYINLFQTGLEPLVVGVYRALVDHLHNRKLNCLGQMIVRPVFFVRDNHLSTGTLWG